MWLKNFQYDKIGSMDILAQTRRMLVVFARKLCNKNQKEIKFIEFITNEQLIAVILTCLLF